MQLSAKRWKTIFTRIESVEETLARMENRIITASGVIIMFLLGLIAAQVMYEKRTKARF